jgi:Relaxase/Mobilisation nuclease domain.
MATIKAVSSRASVGNAINYVTKNEKTESKLISGIGCSPATAIDEMKATKAIWEKTEGRQYKHFVQSFPPDEKITPEQAHEIARQLCADQYPGYEILIATHKDKEHIHSHIILNSVSYEDGRKFQQSKDDLQAMKDKSDELCRERGLSIAVKKDEVTAYTLNKYKAIEKAVTGEYKSFVVDCYRAASIRRGKATSREDFIEQMKAAGWETTWTDSRKHITFTNGEGNKVRASNLEKTFKESFGKEELERGFERNLEATSREREYRPGAAVGQRHESSARESNAGHADATIEKLDAAIRESKVAVEADDRERADRIADEQSRQRERDRAKEQRVIERSRERSGYER